MIHIDSIDDEVKVKRFKKKQKEYSRLVKDFKINLKRLRIHLESEPGYDGGIITYLIDDENDLIGNIYDTVDEQHEYPDSIDIKFLDDIDE